MQTIWNDFYKLLLLASALRSLNKRLVIMNTDVSRKKKPLLRQRLQRLHLACSPLLLFVLAACAVQAPGVTFSVPSPVTDVLPSSSSTLYVSTTGSDKNEGDTLEDAFATLEHAFKVAQARRERGGGTLINVAPGTYRQSVENWTESSGPPIIVRGPEAVVSGSDVFTKWKDEGGGVYSHSWKNNWGFPAEPTSPYEKIDPMVARKECVFNDGNLLRQVKSKDGLSGDTFFVDEKRDTLFINVANLGTVEVCKRAELWETKRTQNLRVEGLTFQHAASAWGESAVYVWGNQTFDGVTVNWNSQSGIHLHGTNPVVRNSRMNDNGFSGLIGYGVENGLVENSEWSRNNWRGDWWDHYTWDTGNKTLHVRGLTLRGNLIKDNKSNGWWCDTNCENVEFYGNTVTGNKEDGLHLELSQGPFRIYNNVFRNNGYDITCSTVDQCLVTNNDMDGALRVVQSERFVPRSASPFGMRRNYHPESKGFQVEGNSYDYTYFEHISDDDIKNIKQNAVAWTNNTTSNKVVKDDTSYTKETFQRVFNWPSFN